jgi:hypothetical protein
MLKTWKKNGISTSTQNRIAQKLPGSYENNIFQFTFMINITKKLCFKPGQRDNMDEMPLHFNVSSSKNVKGAQLTISKTSSHKEIC